MHLHRAVIILLAIVVAGAGRFLFSWNPKKERGWIPLTALGIGVAVVALLIGYGYIPL